MNYEVRKANYEVRSAKCELRGSLSKRAFLWLLTVYNKQLTISALQLNLSLYGAFMTGLSKESMHYMYANIGINI